MYGAALFAFPASYLGQLSGLPAAVPPLYRFLLASFVFCFGCAYIWLAQQKSVSRLFVLFGALDKTLVFFVVFALWLAQESPLEHVLIISGDLAFAVMWVFWLISTRQSASVDVR